jgi:hypothetical protein
MNSKNRIRTSQIRIVAAALALVTLAAQPFVTIGAPPAMSSPNADQLLDRYVQALGGTNALDAIKTRYTQRTAVLGTGGLTEKLLQKAPDKMLITLPSGQKYGFDGTNAWEQSSRGTVRNMAREARATFFQDADFPPGLHLRKRFQSLSLIKQGAPACSVGILGTLADGSTQRWFFAEATGLAIRREIFSKGAKVPEAVCEYDDYRTVDGVMVPFTIRLNPGSMPSFNYQVTEVKHNLPVDDTKFEKPPTR